jgi:hypothetical protein
MATMRTVNCVFVADGSFTSIRIGTEEGMTVALLKSEIKRECPTTVSCDAKNLTLFLAKDGNEWLAADSTDVASLEDRVVTGRLSGLMSKAINPLAAIDDVFGGAPTHMKIHVLVKLPDSTVQQSAEAALAQQFGTLPVQHPLPAMLPLEHREELAKESLLTEWETGMVHEVPLIYNFMKDLGGCSTNGKLYWRREDQQLVSLLVKVWFEENISDTLREYSGKQSIVMGSPGIGKSTALCVLAFYLALTRKKRVLVYRWLTKGNCLFYLSYDDALDEVHYFSVANCEDEEAVRIYKQLLENHKSGDDSEKKQENVFLLLDGFYRTTVPNGMRSFRLLATSQQVDLKSQDTDAVFSCLLSSWKREDVVKLGEKVLEFSPREIDRRYYLSGGNVRDFRRTTKVAIKVSIDKAISAVEDASQLFSNSASIRADKSQSDRLRRTFIRQTSFGDEEEEWDDALRLISPQYWEQVVDSEYAVFELWSKFRSEMFLQVFNWASGVGHNSLAGSVFELYLHRLACDNRMDIFASTYERGKPNEVAKLEVKRGGARCSGDTKTYREKLEQWRDDDTLTYWFPACYDFPNIDAIVKLTGEDSMKVKVAYLQITMAKTHAIDDDQLKKMNEIFWSEKIKTSGRMEQPIYIALCPKKKTAEGLALGTKRDAADASQVCGVCVGYCEESAISSAATTTAEEFFQDATPTSAVKHPYNLRSSARSNISSDTAGAEH